MKTVLWIMLILIIALFVSCGKDTRDVDNTEDQKKTSNALYRHLGITRWSRPLSANRGRQYKEVQVVYQLEDQEEVASRLTLGSNVSVDGNLEVMIQEDIDKRVIVSMAFIKNGSSFSTRAVFDKKFSYGPGSFGFGYRDEEWQEVSLLKAGGESGASSQIDDPKNLEKVLLRLVK